MRFCIVIPAFNEAKTIGQVVETLRLKGFAVVVIDDGSCDHTGQIAQARGAVVILHEKNKGKGASLQDGFYYAIQKNYEWVLTMDGDGQHDPADIPQFIEKAKANPRSVITGNRMHNHQGMPLVRLCTNRFMSGLISGLCKQEIPDTQCGFRLISCDILKEIKLTAGDYEIETEVLIKASKKNFKIYSVPVQTIYLDEASKINPIIDTLRFIRYIIKEIFSPKP